MGTLYIDNIIMWWNGTEDELLSFHSYLNNINTNVELSLEYSKDRIHFLDLEISKDENGFLHSSILRKNAHKILYSMQRVFIQIH